MFKFLWFELNIEECAVGAFIQFPFYFLIGWWVIPFMVVSALLWAIGGSKEGKKIVRRIGVPLTTFIALIATGTAYWPSAFGAAAAFGIVSIGYGESSALYKLMYKLYFTERTATFATRLITYVLYWLVFAISFHWVKP